MTFDECERNTRLGPEVYAPLLYKGKTRLMLHRFKFKHYTGYAMPLARLMAQCLQGVAFDVITWVPCSLARKIARGYDQSRLLAKKLARVTGMPAVKLICRKGFATPQYKLKSAAEREANISGKYRALRRADYATVLLVDDIYTTGATFRACARVLKDAGAGRVLLCAAAAKQTAENCYDTTHRRRSHKEEWPLI
ncbi:MAG: hypothetical protein LBI44_07745 [Oscillospiraceae bacterium]|jgi:ComF family protein|nr:hypothetical protein [Oscillospiraceae bacterium]